jgi:hypothetical protein
MAQFPFKDLTFQTFGKLKVLYQSAIKKHNRVTWVCRCSCGNQCLVTGNALVMGNTSSCGCGHYEGITTHGLSKTPTYKSWNAMVGRCTKPNWKDYARYGAIGITVCGRWLGEKGFENFLADMGTRPEGTTLDRYPNNAGNYEPGNCRWATPQQQNTNQRHLVFYEHEGKRMTITEWERELGFKKTTLRARIQRYGMTFEEAIKK